MQVAKAHGSDCGVIDEAEAARPAYEKGVDDDSDKKTEDPAGARRGEQPAAAARPLLIGPLEAKLALKANIYSEPDTFEDKATLLLDQAREVSNAQLQRTMLQQVAALLQEAEDDVMEATLREYGAPETAAGWNEADAALGFAAAEKDGSERPPVEAPKASLKQRAALWASSPTRRGSTAWSTFVQRAAAVLLRESWHPSTHAEFMLLQVRAQYTLAESRVADLGAARGRSRARATADADKAGGGGGGGGAGGGGGGGGASVAGASAASGEDGAGGPGGAGAMDAISAQLPFAATALGVQFDLDEHEAKLTAKPDLELGEDEDGVPGGARVVSAKDTARANARDALMQVQLAELRKVEALKGRVLGALVGGLRRALRLGAAATPLVENGACTSGTTTCTSSSAACTRRPRRASVAALEECGKALRECGSLDGALHAAVGEALAAVPRGAPRRRRARRAVRDDRALARPMQAKRLVELQARLSAARRRRRRPRGGQGEGRRRRRREGREEGRQRRQEGRGAAAGGDADAGEDAEAIAAAAKARTSSARC